MTDFLRQFRTRRLLCGTLADFSSRQQSLAASGDDAALVDLLARKDRVLQRLAGESGPELVAEWQSARDYLDPDTRAQCQALLDECEAALAEVMAMDGQSITAVTARRDETQRQLKTAQQNERTAAGYAAADAPAAAPRLNVAG